LFFGDVESSWRKESDKSVNADIGKTAKELNRAIWEEAAKSWNEGRLAGIFVSCRSCSVQDVGRRLPR
jgi:hypothetical protein